VHLAAMVAAVEAHVAPARLADLLEAEHLGPEFVRFFHVADIDHEMVDADRDQRLGGGFGDDLAGAVGHRRAPRSKGGSVRNYMGLPRALPIAPALSAVEPAPGKAQ